MSHASLTRLCTREGLAGLEFGAGIPGTIGGWVAMNAGIGEREAKDVVRRIEVVSPTGRHRKQIDREIGVGRRVVTRCRSGIAIRVPDGRRQVTPPEAGDPGRRGAGRFELGLERTAAGEPARQTLANAHAVVGVGQQMVEARDPENVRFRHAGLPVHLGRNALAQPALAFEQLEHLLAIRSFGKHRRDLSRGQERA